LGRFAADVLVLNDPLEGISIKSECVSETGVSILRASGKAKFGMAGNLLIGAVMETENPNNIAAKKRKVPLGLLRAIPFVIL